MWEAASPRSSNRKSRARRSPCTRARRRTMKSMLAKGTTPSSIGAICGTARPPAAARSGCPGEPPAAAKRGGRAGLPLILPLSLPVPLPLQSERCGDDRIQCGFRGRYKYDRAAGMPAVRRTGLVGSKHSPASQRQLSSDQGNGCGDCYLREDRGDGLVDQLLHVLHSLFAAELQLEPLFQLHSIPFDTGSSGHTAPSKVHRGPTALFIGHRRR